MQKINTRGNLSRNNIYKYPPEMHKICTINQSGKWLKISLMIMLDNNKCIVAQYLKHSAM